MRKYKTLRQIKIIFLFATMIFCAPIFASSEKTSAEQLARLLDQSTTLQAQFTQKTTDVQQQTLQRSRGIVMIARPGRFRWETQHPMRQVVITDGNVLWIYDIDLKQATRESIKNSPINPAKLLSGNVDALLQQFHVHMIPHHTILVFQLIPKEPNQQFRSVSMAFLHDKLHIMQIENNMKQTTTFTFSHVKINPDLSPSLFQFKAPSDVDVLQ